MESKSCDHDCESISIQNTTMKKNIGQLYRDNKEPREIEEGSKVPVWRNLKAQKKN